ncbi:hypothetical protein ACJIZ3_005251 [Penstemon smallii]|uniref:Uncharacterized protein n=1 Tax=Penstemon smallii TaxID=265156 RepID=A0ABD3S4D7_9LAMI
MTLYKKQKPTLLLPPLPSPLSSLITSRDFQCTESRVFNLKPEAFAVNLAESRDFKLKPEVFAVNLAESRDFKLKFGVYLLSIGQSHGCSI